MFGVQLGLRQAQALIEAKTIRRGKVPPAILLLSSKLLLSSNVAGGTFPLLIGLVLINSCVLPKAELNNKNVTRYQVAPLLLPG